MRSTDLPAAVLARKAVIYVRQSNSMQVVNNQESQRRQYELVEVARDQGFRDIEVIDDDLGRAASGAADRPGFDRLVTMMYENMLGAVVCLDATRLARNGRDWEHLLEVCGFVGARIVDLKQVYDPTLPNDRLLLGLQGTFATFELSQLHHRMSEAAQAKARRGELRLAVPPGFIWDREEGLDLDPDELLQSTIRAVSARFRKLGSACQVLLAMKKDEFHFPGPSGHRKGASFQWRPIRYYYNVMSILKNPFYAGAYAYGKTGPRTSTIDGRLRKSYGHLSHHSGLANTVCRADRLAGFGIQLVQRAAEARLVDLVPDPGDAGRRGVPLRLVDRSLLNLPGRTRWNVHRP